MSLGISSPYAATSLVKSSWGKIVPVRVSGRKQLWRLRQGKQPKTSNMNLECEDTTTDARREDGQLKLKVGRLKIDVLAIAEMRWPKAKDF